MTFPSDHTPLLIEVFFQADDPAFICGVHGALTTDVMEAIDKQLDDDPDLKQGDGTYLFSATWDSGQFDELGRCELPPYWDLTLVDFRPIANEESALNGETALEALAELADVALSSNDGTIWTCDRCGAEGAEIVMDEHACLVSSEGEKKMSYDPRCYELAQVFIEPDNLLAGRDCAERATEELAQVIQTAIEDYLEGVEKK